LVKPERVNSRKEAGIADYGERPIEEQKPKPELMNSRKEAADMDSSSHRSRTDPQSAERGKG
jgi:hypothetical protein